MIEKNHQTDALIHELINLWAVSFSCNNVLACYSESVTLIANLDNVEVGS